MKKHKSKKKTIVKPSGLLPNGNNAPVKPASPALWLLLQKLCAYRAVPSGPEQTKDVSRPNAPFHLFGYNYFLNPPRAAPICGHFDQNVSYLYTRKK